MADRASLRIALQPAPVGDSTTFATKTHQHTHRKLSLTLPQPVKTASLGTGTLAECTSAATLQQPVLHNAVDRYVCVETGAEKCGCLERRYLASLNRPLLVPDRVIKVDALGIGGATKLFAFGIKFAC